MREKLIHHILVIDYCVSFPNRTKALVLELLAAVCLVRGGHEIILSAFDNFKEVGYSVSSESMVRAHSSFRAPISVSD